MKLKSSIQLFIELCSLPNRNCSHPTEKTKMPLRMLSHASVNLYAS